MIPLSSRIDKYKKIVENKKKAVKVVGMLKRGVKFTPTQPDVMKMIEKLTER